MASAETVPRTPYLDRLKAVDAIVLDPGSVRDWHVRGQDWFERTAVSGAVLGDAASLVAKALLMGLERASADDVLGERVDTIAVNDRVICINGVAMAHPEGLPRGEPDVSRSILLHEAIHLVLNHPVRMTRLLNELSRDGLVGPGRRLSAREFMRVANTVLDIIDDRIGGDAVSSIEGYACAFLDEHRRAMAEDLRSMIDAVCAELDADEVVFALEQGQVSAEKALRAIVCAMPETVEAISTDREAPGARTESGRDGSVEDDAETAGEAGAGYDEGSVEDEGVEDECEAGGGKDDARSDRERAAGRSREQEAGARGLASADGAVGTDGDVDEGDAAGSVARASAKEEGAGRGEAGGEPASGSDRHDGVETKGANDEVVRRALERSELHVVALDDRSDSGIDAAQVAQVARAMLAGREAGGEGAFARIALAAGTWLVPAQVDWRTELEVHLAGGGERIGYERTCDSELYRRPQVVLPGRLPTIRRVAVALDTSLSVTGRPEILGRFLGEVAGKRSTGIVLTRSAQALAFFAGPFGFGRAA